MRILLALLALSTVLTAAPQISESKAISTFKKGFRGTRAKPPSVEQRRTALKQLDGHDSKAVAKALVDAWLLLETEVNGLDASRMEANAELADIIKGKEFDANRVFPKAQFDRRRELIKLVDEQRQQVDALREFQFALRARIASVREPQSLSWLLDNVVGSKRHTIRLKIAVADAAGSLGEEMLEELSRALLRAKQTQAVIALLDGVGRVGSSARDCAPRIIGLLGHKDGAVRERAALALSRIAVAEAIEPMIDLLEREEGQARKRIAAALEILTRQQFGDSIGSWRAWFEQEGSAYLSGTKLLGRGTPSNRERTNQKNYYFGIPQDGKSILYVIDSSGSMKAPVDFNLGKTVAGGKSQMTRLEACKAELIRALGRLQSDKNFNIIWYSDLPHLYAKASSRATKTNIQKGQDWVRRLQPTSSTNIHDSLQMGFSLTGRGSHDKHYGVAVDTVFLLTDGSPTKPDGKLDSTEKIVNAVRAWNPLKRVTIHCIGIGKGLNQGFLRQLASENGGEFKQY